MGWLATREAALLERCQTIEDYTTNCHSAQSEVLSFISLRAGGRIVGRSLVIVPENLDIVAPFFAGHRDLFRWIEPRGGSVTFPIWTGSMPPIGGTPPPNTAVVPRTKPSDDTAG
jgi:hypothetical protein